MAQEKEVITTTSNDLLLEKMNALEQRIDELDNNNKDLQSLNRKLLNSKGGFTTDDKTEKEKADIKAVQDWIDKGGRD